MYICLLFIAKESEETETGEDKVPKGNIEEVQTSVNNLTSQRNNVENYIDTSVSNFCFLCMNQYYCWGISKFNRRKLKLNHLLMKYFSMISVQK